MFAFLISLLDSVVVGAVVAFKEPPGCGGVYVGGGGLLKATHNMTILRKTDNIKHINLKVPLSKRGSIFKTRNQYDLHSARIKQTFLWCVCLFVLLLCCFAFLFSCFVLFHV